MSADSGVLEKEILALYQEPVIGSGYANTYGEQNLVALVEKYRSLPSGDMGFMAAMVTAFSTSTDLSASYISVGVLHALGMEEQVNAAYAWAETQESAQSIAHHFDIGKSLADHFIS